MINLLYKKKTKDFIEMENMCLQKNFVVIDFEIAQVRKKNVPIDLLEIGAVYIEDCKIKDTYSSLIKPKNLIEERITNITNITNDMVENEKPVEIVFKDFYDWLKVKIDNGSILVAHNASSTDIAFLKELIDRFNYPSINLDFICTLKLSNYYFPNFHKHTLTNLCVCFDVPLETHHRALNDCIMTAKYFLKLRKNVVPLSLNNELDKVYQLGQRSLNYKNEIKIEHVKYWEKNIRKNSEKIIHRLYIQTNKEEFVYNIDDKYFYERDSKEELILTNKLYYSFVNYLEDKYKVEIKTKKEFITFINKQFLKNNI